VTRICQPADVASLLRTWHVLAVLKVELVPDSGQMAAWSCRVIVTFILHVLMQAKVDDLAISVQNASSVAGHLRFMDKKEVLHKLERLSSERQKFSFQPFITGPYSAINIIMERMCKARLVQKQ